jgi:hypothetical protein
VALFRRRRGFNSPSLQKERTSRPLSLPTTIVFPSLLFIHSTSLPHSSPYPTPTSLTLTSCKLFHPLSASFLRARPPLADSSLLLPPALPFRSGKGKSGKASTTEGADGKKSVSRSAKAGLQFPVGRIHRLLKKGNYAQRVGAGAPVYLAAVLECEQPSSSLLLPRSASNQQTDVGQAFLLLSLAFPLLSQTSRPRSSSSPVTPPGTTKSRESSLDTSSSRSETTRSSTSFSVTSSSPREVSCPPSSPSCCPPSRPSREGARPVARLLRRSRAVVSYYESIPSLSKASFVFLASAASLFRPLALSLLLSRPTFMMRCHMTIYTCMSIPRYSSSI